MGTDTIKTQVSIMLAEAASMPYADWLAKWATYLAGIEDLAPGIYEMAKLKETKQFPYTHD